MRLPQREAQSQLEKHLSRNAIETLTPEKVTLYFRNKHETQYDDDEIHPSSTCSSQSPAASANAEQDINLLSTQQPDFDQDYFNAVDDLDEGFDHSPADFDMGFDFNSGISGFFDCGELEDWYALEGQGFDMGEG